MLKHYHGEIFLVLTKEPFSFSYNSREKGIKKSNGKRLNFDVPGMHYQDFPNQNEFT
jgi:hypothetical protein